MVDNNDLNTLPGLIYWEDTSMHLQGCNNDFANFLGYSSPNELIGLPLSTLASDEKSRKKIQQNNDKVVKTNGSLHCKESFQHKNGETKHILFAKKTCLDKNNKIIGIMAIGSDITEYHQKQIALETTCEKAIATTQAKAKFLACMSHDLRTPLSAIIGLAQILRAQNLSPAHKEFIGDILSSSEILKTLIEDILDLSKIEADQLDFSEVPFDLHALIEETISQLKFLAEQKHLTLKLAYNDADPRFLLGDPHRIKQILMNLIGNAIKFTEEGHILLAIKVIEYTMEKVTLQIVVEDTGIGIDKDKINDIFNRFYQVKPSHFEKTQGSGLGLAIVKYLVNKMEGVVFVNSEKGSGSKFCCQIKLKRQQEDTQLAEWLSLSNNFNFLIIDNDIKQEKFILNKIIADDVMRANDSLALSLIQNQNKEDPYQIILLDEKILLNNEGYMKQLMSSAAGTMPNVIVYGKSTDKYLLNKHKEVFDFLNTQSQSPELIGLLIKACRNIQEQENSRVQPIKLDKVSEPYVLLVEDNPINQKVINIMLKNHGCKVDIAGTGEKALRLASDHYNIIFMDIGLPDINGIDVTKKLLRENIISKTPIIALTAHASESDRDLCLAAGMKDFISKPISNKKLTTVLTNYL